MSTVLQSAVERHDSAFRMFVLTRLQYAIMHVDVMQSYCNGRKIMLMNEG